MQDIQSRLDALSPEKRAMLKKILASKMQDDAARLRFDTVILGGGLAGLTLARQLKMRRPETSILIIDKHKHPVREAAFKIGESTVELGTRYLREVLDLKDMLDQEHLPKAGLRYFFPCDDNRDIVSRVEYGHPDLPAVPSHQIDRGRFENRLAEMLQEMGVQFWDDSKIIDVTIAQPHTVTVKRGDKTVAVSGRWIVDGSGRGKVLKRKLDLVKEVPHNGNAVWFRLDDVIDTEDWTTDPAWKSRVPDGVRRLATVHLMGVGYWVWIIPLSSGGTSIGLVVDAEMYPMKTMNRFDRLLAWFEEKEPQLAAELATRQHLLQDFGAFRHYSYSCERMYSAERWCLTGEAGISIDPFYSPGTDFIAIGNGFITDLIERDLKGEQIAERIEYYNHTYFQLYDDFMVLYDGQYGLLGNTPVMIAKVNWDWAVYWGFIVLLYFRDKLTDANFMSSITADLHQITLLNKHMQSFLREWDLLTRDVELRDKNYKPFDIEFLRIFYDGLKAELNDHDLKQQIAENVALVEEIAVGIVAKVGKQFPELAAQFDLAHIVQRPDMTADSFGIDLSWLITQTDLSEAELTPQ